MDLRIRNIVVGVADPGGADSALSVCIELARTTGAQLHAVHAYDLPEPLHAACAGEEEFVPGWLAAYASEAKHRLEERLRAASAPDGWRLELVRGPASRAICAVAEARNADLVVIAGSRRRRIWRQRLGTTAEAVVRCSPAAVLMVAGFASARPARVLLPTDLTAFSGASQARGLEIVSALLGHPPEARSLLVVRDGSPLPGITRERLERMAQSELDRFLRERLVRGDRVQSRVRLGSPADEVLAEAMEWQADLIVMALNGGEAPGTARLGSVAGSVLRGSACSVLVVPGSAPAAGLQTSEPPRVAVPA